KYTKHFKAVAVIDSSFLDNDLKEKIKVPDIDGDFEIIIVSLDTLKEVYEDTYKVMLKTYESS
ncbi:MAG: hypothetical protein AABY31_02830, partial [Thermoproteota archaeon]